jgi:hypothetical protein
MRFRQAETVRRRPCPTGAGLLKSVRTIISRIVAASPCPAPCPGKPRTRYSGISEGPVPERSERQGHPARDPPTEGLDAPPVARQTTVARITKVRFFR